MINLKELVQKEEKFIGGHHLCPGCGAAIAARQAVLALQDKPLVVVSATGCVEVSTTLLPSTSWNVPWFHSAFENAPASASGIWAAYKALKRSKKLPQDLQILVLAGDGSTYDIGFQSLSGACEREDNFIYICYNNEAYMNTGMQKSSASPQYSITSTTPELKRNKTKDITKLMIDHDIEYAAQASIGYAFDYIEKVQKASQHNGVKFINVITPCTRGWGFDPSKTLNYAKLAVDTAFWPSYEYENGHYHITQNRDLVKVEEFLKGQKRFDLTNSNLELIQESVYNKWNQLLKLERDSNENNG